jgi:pyruvate ferredoxin oxidoreductase gamma subunit
MFQIRIHGRGGQGVVTAAEMLSIAAFQEGKYAQAFPSFGSERMGAPVVAFCRIHDREIRSREPIMRPDALIIQNPTLLHSVDLFAGLASEGYILLNSGRGDPSWSPFESLGIGELVDRFPPGHVRSVPATELALAHVGRPIPNAALLGGFAALTGAVALESIKQAIHEKFPGPIGEKNIAAAIAAYEACSPPIHRAGQPSAVS